MKTVFSEEQIQSRIRAMGQDISRDYGQEVIHAVAILEDGFMFLADLVRRVTSPVVCHFLKMQMMDSQDSGHQPRRNIVYGSLGEVQGQNILLVDALVDSGITLDHLVQQVLLKKPKSIRTATLINREEGRRVALQIDYAGFSWDGGRLVGYGMDKEGLYRNLPYVATISANSSHGGAGEAERGGRESK